jgi:peptide deformylase
MSVLTVLSYPDPFLKVVANPVVKFDNSLKIMAQNMIETMYENKGVGLAATQVGENRRFFVMDVHYTSETPMDQRHPLIIINPVMIVSEGEQTLEEGCLSIPEYRTEIRRYALVKIEYSDLKQNKQILEATGLEAVCIQHEMDHLKGKLFIDYLPNLKRKMIRKRIKKKVKLKNYE